MRSLLCMAGLLASCFLSVAVHAEPPPAEIFGGLPLSEIGRLSPDGKHLAAIQPIKGRKGVMIYDLSVPTAQPHAVALDQAVAEDVFWKTNDRLICIFVAQLKQKWSKDIYSWSRSIGVDANGQHAALLMHDQPFLKLNFSGSIIADLAAGDPDHIYMVAFDKHDRNTTAAVHSFDGKGGRNFSVDGLIAGENPSFAVRKPAPHGTTGLYPWTPSGGFGAALFENQNYDLNDTLSGERTGRVIGVTYVDDTEKVKYFDSNMQRVQTSLEKAFPGQAVQILSRDDADREYVIETEGPRNPPVMSLYTPANHQVNIVQESYPALKSSDLGEVKPYPYKGRDGLDIHAYLTLPPGRTPRNLPTVIFPHGGPEARDSMEFDWWAQFMASRGYAVLQPNYRGSSGYGWNFVKAGDGEWARQGARRFGRRRAKADRGWHRGPQTHLHRRRQLGRISRAAGRFLQTGPLRLRHQLCRCLGPQS